MVRERAIDISLASISLLQITPLPTAAFPRAGLQVPACRHVSNSIRVKSWWGGGELEQKSSEQGEIKFCLLTSLFPESIPPPPILSFFFFLKALGNC